MPSKAYGTFKSNLKQVDRLLEAFVKMRTPTKGRKCLDHFTRAALIFLCSSWEVYIEQVSNESGRLIANKLNVPGQLPEIAKKTVAKKIKDSKHELSPIEFSNDWKQYYCDLINEYTSMLNTPKKDKIMELFNKYIGVPGERIISEVPSLGRINKIVSDRGNIAHNIYTDEYLKKETVDDYYQIIVQLVKEIEILLWNYIPEVTDGKRPWQNTY